MAFYDNDASWSGPARQASWDKPSPPSRSGAASATSSRPETNAFASQFEEIERATDNLMKSGKWPQGQAHSVGAARRDSAPPGAKGLEYGGDPRMGAGASRHQSAGEQEGGRPGSSGLQGYYQGQRFPGGRQSEAEQMLQVKRRMAAQRERELRNYHQEQQYNRTVSGGKSDRSMSPTTMSEEDRRDLIARQHRALYGESSTLYDPDLPSQRSSSRDVRASSGGRGPSPLAFDPYGVQAQAGGEGSVQMPPREGQNSTASPVSATHQSFNLLGDAQQSSRTSNSSPGGSPPLSQNQKGGVSGVAPIGTRPTQPPTSVGGLGKRSTTPLTPSALSHGVSIDSKDDRSTSNSSNPQLGAEKGVPLGGWGSGSGVWGSTKTTLAVQPSVWG